MKQKLYLNIFVYFIFGFVLSCAAVISGSAGAKTINTERVSCGKILSDGDIQVFETLECGHERELAGNDNDSPIYQKDVNLIKQFKKSVKENVYKTKAEIKQKFTFTYDKKEKAEIYPQDISSDFTVTDWKISPLSKISIDDGICSVSNQYRVYEKIL
ncbi:MAG: hypothetical protein IKE41_02565 [Clostridia bacterium]|nr:hypothetical protein [Clostridia bacterium]